MTSPASDDAASGLRLGSSDEGAHRPSSKSTGSRRCQKSFATSGGKRKSGSAAERARQHHGSTAAWGRFGHWKRRHAADGDCAIANRVEGHACSWLIGMSRPSLRWPRLAGASSNRPALRRAARRRWSIGGTITHSPACCRRAVERVPSLGVDGVVNSSEPCFVWGTVEHLRGCR
jgi:hypothetical protein